MKTRQTVAQSTCQSRPLLIKGETPQIRRNRKRRVGDISSLHADKAQIDIATRDSNSCIECSENACFERERNLERDAVAARDEQFLVAAAPKAIFQSSI